MMAMEPAETEPLADLRRRLVEDLARRGIADLRVLAAIGAAPRHRFVDETMVEHAYEDRPLPIGGGQTISQPYIVALMIEAARVAADDVVLEVGTGSGYGAAVLGRLAADVTSIERREELAATARARLAADEGVGDRVRVVVGDGSRGWPDGGPYDAIVVTASPRSVPPDLVRQLADGGRLVIPVGRRRRIQQLLRIERHGAELHRQTLAPVRFVPLI